MKIFKSSDLFKDKVQFVKSLKDNFKKFRRDKNYWSGKEFRLCYQTGFFFTLIFSKLIISKFQLKLRSLPFSILFSQIKKFKEFKFCFQSRFSCYF